MQRCIELARKGMEKVAPNPMVGCVIVYENRIIGEGYHHAFGKPHAEVNAINAVKEKKLLKESTLYVNLEPCSHFGKTPPCSDYILKNKIKKVVTACRDPNKEVNGKGIQQLKKNGAEVMEGVLEQECIFLNRRFITFHRKKRPYIILKWAQSNDGFIAPLHQQKGKQFQISSKLSQTLVHRWRSEEQAILVGTNTAMKDNPVLNVRFWKGKNPLRVVIDRELKLPMSLNLFKGKQSTLVFTEKKKRKSGNAEFINVGSGSTMLDEIMEHLHSLAVLSVMIEGGALLLQNFINRNLWDEARVFTSPPFLFKGIHAPTLNYPVGEEYKIDTDHLRIYYNKTR
jgi:diaminohydroxyphosphoribosylaminopyrimidine deaminase/5-amino-6-(5-phosphoribosylamino)uracil reductase